MRATTDLEDLGLDEGGHLLVDHALAQLRPGPNKVTFAMNAIPDLGPGNQAEIAVGDEVSFAPAPF